jgi:hypothetical protein
MTALDVVCCIVEGLIGLFAAYFCLWEPPRDR